MQGLRSTISCLGCKRRKKGCDFKRPTCGRCQRLAEQCVYEQREYIFVTTTKTTSSQGSNRSLQTTVSRTPSPTSQAALRTTDVALQVAAGFWGVYLPSDEGPVNLNVGSAAPWIYVVRNMAEKNHIVQLAVDALSFTGLGWWRQDTAMVQQGVQIYALTLRKVNEALQKPDFAQSDVTLACCRVLSLFEMLPRKADRPGLASNQSLDWRKHAEGTWQILKLRGRAPHVDGDGFRLYDAVRMTAVIQGFGRRQSNAFLELPWDPLPRLDLRDELFELLMTVPALLEKADMIKHGCASTQSVAGIQMLIQQGTELLPRLLAVGNDLRQWEFDALLTCVQKDLTQPEACSSDLFAASTTHGDAFFSLCTQYWAACLSLYSTAQELWHCLDTISSDLAPKTILPDWIDPAPYATYIAQVAAHFFRPERGLWGAQGAIFPLMTALRCMSSPRLQASAERRMILDSFTHTQSGIIMSDFLQSVMRAKN